MHAMLSDSCCGTVCSLCSFAASRSLPCSCARCFHPLLPASLRLSCIQQDPTLAADRAGGLGGLWEACRSSWACNFFCTLLARMLSACTYHASREQASMYNSRAVRQACGVYLQSTWQGVGIKGGSRVQRMQVQHTESGHRHQEDGRGTMTHRSQRPALTGQSVYRQVSKGNRCCMI